MENYWKSQDTVLKMSISSTVMAQAEHEIRNDVLQRWNGGQLLADYLLQLPSNGSRSGCNLVTTLTGLAGCLRVVPWLSIFWKVKTSIIR
ncbi:hypothetical protein AVEN_101637-1 [Araneus ventricosus]|uniref:Uncharacterized protein n=1 Tax=Araneus ventricosus TaxID=182803 RepID=A0A4Y2EYL5_ARAVE|nr:hypothetical protein AVEN_101637-1 [Araneus ventricosus]